MNRTVKTILIIAACLIPIGIIATFIGLRFGGQAGWSLDLNDGSLSFANDMVTEAVDLKDFDSLDLKVSTADVNIVRGDSYKIEYKVRKGKEPKIKQEGGKLTIEQPPMGFVMFNFGLHEGENTFIIYVPESSGQITLNAKASTGDIMLDRIRVSGKIEASTSDILLNDIEGDELEVNISSGDIDGDKVKIAKTRFEGSTSDISILRLFSDDVYCHASTGDIDINDSAVSNLKADTSTGDVNIQLNGKPDDYSYNIKVSTGDIVVNGEEVEKSIQKDNGSDRKIEISTSTGDVDVEVH